MDATRNAEFFGPPGGYVMAIVTAADWIQAGAAVFTSAAALCALIIAAKAPKWAARWAETYRSQSEKSNEREKLRTYILMTLLRCRKTLVHADALGALNMIDVAFHDCKAIREAHKSFIDATNAQPYSAQTIVERYHFLIDKIVQEMGFGDSISVFDIRNGYYPEALGRIDEAALADADEKIAKRDANRG